MAYGSPPRSSACRGAYDSDDLDSFKAVLSRILADLRASRSPLVEPEQIELTKVRLAAAIFQLANSGIKDPIRLQDLAQSRLDAGSAGPSPSMFYLHNAPLTRH